MENFINKLERKIGRYAIPNLINYFVIAYVASTILCIIPIKQYHPLVGAYNTNFYNLFLALDFSKIATGQVWRLITFILAPGDMSSGIGILFFVITVHLYYLFGHSLERAWGSFRFNLYFVGGIVLTLLAELIVFVASGYTLYFYGDGLNYVYETMFFAFCTLFPNETFLLYFVIPIKAKYLAAIDGIFMVVRILQYMANGYYSRGVAIMVAMLNFAIFFYMYKGLSRFSPKQIHRRSEFRRQTSDRVNHRTGVAKHKCAVCGRTSETNPELSFRFCSKCNGNYEYCEEHIFTHTHVE